MKFGAIILRNCTIIFKLSSPKAKLSTRMLDLSLGNNKKISGCKKIWQQFLSRMFIEIIGASNGQKSLIYLTKLSEYAGLSKDI
jgi:hypothetical protein